MTQDTTLGRCNSLQAFLIRRGGRSKLGDVGGAAALVVIQHEVLIMSVTSLVLPESGVTSSEESNDPGLLASRLPGPVLFEVIVARLNSASGACYDKPDHGIEGRVHEEATLKIRSGTKSHKMQ